MLATFDIARMFSPQEASSSGCPATGPIKTHTQHTHTLTHHAHTHTHTHTHLSVCLFLSLSLSLYLSFLPLSSSTPHTTLSLPYHSTLCTHTHLCLFSPGYSTLYTWLCLTAKFGITASYSIMFLMAAEIFPTVVRCRLHVCLRSNVQRSSGSQRHNVQRRFSDISTSVNIPTSIHATTFVRQRSDVDQRSNVHPCSNVPQHSNVHLCSNVQCSSTSSSGQGDRPGGCPQHHTHTHTHTYTHTASQGKSD